MFLMTPLSWQRPYLGSRDCGVAPLCPTDERERVARYDVHWVEQCDGRADDVCDGEPRRDGAGVVDSGDGEPN